MESCAFWPGRRVVLTGATGFIGHHLAMRLVRHGATVTALVRAGSAIERLRLNGIACVDAPLERPEEMARAAAGSDLLFHLAGAVDFGNDWDHCEKINVRGTANVLSAARIAGVRRFIQTSSIVAIGASRGGRILDETARWNLRDYLIPYVSTKREGEQYVLANTGLPEVVVVNPACVVGPDDFSSSEFGTLCQRYWRGKIPFYFGGGSNFVDVRDVAEGLMLAAEKGRPGERYLLTGENVAFSEFFALLSKIANRRIFRIRLPNVVARVGARLADRLLKRKSRPSLSSAHARLLGLYFFFEAAKARRELGYRARPLAESLADAHEFWMSRKSAA